MTTTPDDPVDHAVPSDQPPSVDADDAHDPHNAHDAGPAPADEAARQAQDTVRSISRLEESN